MKLTNKQIKQIEELTGHECVISFQKPNNIKRYMFVCWDSSEFNFWFERNSLYTNSDSSSINFELLKSLADILESK